MRALATVRVTIRLTREQAAILKEASSLSRLDYRGHYERSTSVGCYMRRQAMKAAMVFLAERQTAPAVSDAARAVSAGDRGQTSRTKLRVKS